MRRDLEGECFWIASRLSGMLGEPVVVSWGDGKEEAGMRTGVLRSVIADYGEPPRIGLMVEERTGAMRQFIFDVGDRVRVDLLT